MSKYSDNEQHNVIMAMDALYARIHELRDAVNGNNWDDSLDTATLRAWQAMRELSGSIGALA